MKGFEKIGLTALLSAGLLSSAMAVDKDIADRMAVWVTGTYTEPSNNTLSFGDLQQSAPVGDFDGVHRTVFIDQDFSFDYAFGLAYRFTCTDTRFFVSFEHFADSERSSNGDIRNMGYRPERQTPHTSGRAQVSTHAEEFRFGLSHLLEFSPQFRTNFMAFFEWDDYKQNLTESLYTVFAGINTPNNVTRDTFNRAKGWGPGLGLMVQTVPFRCLPAWGFFMGGKTSLIWAESNYEVSLVAGDDLAAKYDPETTENVINKVDLALGISYNRRYSRLCDMMLDVNLGIRYLNVYNVFKNGNAYANPVYAGSTNVNYATNLGYAADWGRFGPFLTFAIGGANS